MSTTDLSYDQLMAIVYALPALHPTGVARALLGTLVALIAINTITIALRIYVRVVMTRGAFGVDDVIAMGGYVCFLVATVYGIEGCFYGLGTRDADLPSELYMVRAAQLLLWWQIPYVISIPLIKSAIAVQIMRLTPSLYFRVPLWFVVIGSAFNALAGLIAALVHCKPISASWTGEGTCTSNVPLLDLSYMFTAIAIVADFTCALVPFFLIRGLNMNVRRKWSLIGILSMGIGASIFTIVRVPFFKHYIITKDALYYQGYIAMWSMLEEGIGMFAGSLPSLRKLLKNYYGSSNKSHNGLALTPGAAGAGIVTYGGTGKGGIDAGSTHLNTLHPTAKRGQFSATVSAKQSSWSQGNRGSGGPGGSWEVLDDDDSSRQGIIIQRDVFLQSGEAVNRTASAPASTSGSDDLRDGK